MNRLLRCTPVALGLLLAACHSDTKPGQTAASKQLPVAVALPLPAGSTDSPGAYYRQYQGVLAGSADTITLDLLVAPAQNNNTETANGSASYHATDGHPYELTNFASPAPDSVLLSDSSPDSPAASQAGPNWRLRRQGRDLVGTRNGQALTLHEAPPTRGLALTVRCFADSVVAFPGMKHSPAGRISFQALLPVGALPTLTTNLLRDQRHDTLPNLPAQPLLQLWVSQRQAFQQLYRQDAESIRASTKDQAVDQSLGYGLRYEQQTATSVVWNHAPLLSLGIFSYSYLGGAHGSYGTQVATYDTRTGQRLHFADIFRPGTDDQLSQLLDEAVRRTLRIPSREPLDISLFVRKMPVTRNVCLTSGGAVFIYKPYEIASFAQGEIRLFVPLIQLQPLLKAQLIL